MLSKNVEIIDIDPEQFARVAGLFDTPRLERAPGLILFTSGSRLVHAVHTRKGPDRSVIYHGPAHLSDLVKQSQVKWALCMELSALRRAAANVQGAVRLADPFSEQGRAALQVLQNELGAGLYFCPDPAEALAGLPLQIPAPLLRFLPADPRIMAAVFDDDGGIWACAVLELRDGEIAFVSTSDLLEPLGIEGMDEAACADALLARLAERRGPADLGIFCDRRAFLHLARHPQPGQALQGMVRLGWVSMRPCPWRLRLVLRFVPRLIFKQLAAQRPGKPA